MKISDKWKAVVGALGAFVTGLSFAVEDGNVTIEEAGGLLLALAAAGLAVWRVRNQPA